MSFKITKKRKIQTWIEETVNLINITLAGKEIPIDIAKLPQQLKEGITVHGSVVGRPTFSSSRNLNEISPEIMKMLKKLMEDR